MSLKSELCVIILAAGEGKRMGGVLPKVLHPICGRPMVHYILDAASSLHPGRIILIVGHEGQKVCDSIQSAWKPQNGKLDFVWQRQQKGTGHAVSCAKPTINDEDPLLLILCGDTPFLSPSLLTDFLQFHKHNCSDLSLMTTIVADPKAYGRVLRDPKGNAVKVVEARDLSPEMGHIREVNAGIYLVRASLLFDLLAQVTDENAKKEYYLTDIVSLASGSGHKVCVFRCDDQDAVQGISDRWDLSRAENAKREEILKGLAVSGVTIRDPSSTYIDFGVTVGHDSVIEPQTFLLGNTAIGKGCVIGPGTQIRNSKIGDGSRVWSSVVEDSAVEDNVAIGPFSHLRPDCLIKSGALVGNYAEVKNSVVGSGTKIHHHCYIGDTDLGENVNIGAGTVTVNYDGRKKHRTTIQDRAFVGCNANLIAPVDIGQGSYVAAGSTVTHDVPKGALAIARERQVVKHGWVLKKEEKHNGQGRNQ